MRYFALLGCLLLFFSAGCEQVTEQPTEVVQEVTTERNTATTAAAPDLTIPADSNAVPPAPPLLEDFEGQPQLSLFPRIGDYSPEEDSDRLPFWRTFIEHLTRTAGITTVSRNGTGNRVWSFRSINSIDSLGFFSPVAVKPSTSYIVDFLCKAALPEEASAGIGILEFDRFLWAADQLPESLMNKHSRGVREGVRLSGEIDWQPQSFTFTTGPQTGMIHLVMYRDGAHDRTPVLFDNIKIDVVTP